MDRAELLADFQAKVDEVVKYQGFIDKALAQAERFTPKVVEKVVTDNTAKRDAVVEAILPLLDDIEAAIGELETQKSDILSDQESSRISLEEMELRLMIEELTQEEFDEKAADLQKEVAAGNERISAIDAELETIRTELQRWEDVAQSAGIHTAADEPEPPQEDDLVPEGEEDLFGGPVVDDDGGFVSVDGEPEPDLSGFGDGGADEGVFTESVSIAEDVSVVFGDDDEEEAEDEGLSLEVGDMDTLVDDDLVEVGEAPEEEPPRERHAVMLYQEGTAEEQIYPFTNDVLTLGRGRDNDIQVKNDSKVSRYHCKLYRRNSNFYIEDNKSANGTLVNGELITERRLFGGEEIIIGETFFRFRIMD